MNFYTAIKTVLSRYAQFSGRATRFSPDAGQPLRLLTNLGLLLPSLAVAVRRLHDINRSGWWWLVALVPVIGALFLLWWHMQPGGDGENRFG